MNKTKLVVMFFLVCMVSGTIGAYAATNLQKVTAYINPSFKFETNGTAWQPKDSTGKKMTALLYNNSVYVPLKETLALVNVATDYDPKTGKIYIGEKKAGVNFYTGSLLVTDRSYCDIVEVVDKSQLSFDGKLYKGAYRVTAKFTSSSAPRIHFDLKKPYSTFHGLIYSEQDVTGIAYDDKDRELGTFSLAKDTLNQIDINLQGAQKIYLVCKTQEDDFQIYILKDSYVK